MAARGGPPSAETVGASDRSRGLNVDTSRGYHEPMADARAQLDVQLIDGPLPPPRPAPAAGGGVCTFEGVTRPEIHPTHGPLEGLDYEAYRPMALRMMQELASEAAGRWPCHSIIVHHSTGLVPVGVRSVYISVDCDHRSDAFAACRWLIDTLKERIPIWKRERWRNGSTWVEGEPVVAGTP